MRMCVCVTEKARASERASDLCSVERECIFLHLWTYIVNDGACLNVKNCSINDYGDREMFAGNNIF